MDKSVTPQIIIDEIKKLKFNMLPEENNCFFKEYNSAIDNVLKAIYDTVEKSKDDEGINEDNFILGLNNIVKMVNEHNFEPDVNMAFKVGILTAIDNIEKYVEV